MLAARSAGDARRPCRRRGAGVGRDGSDRFPGHRALQGGHRLDAHRRQALLVARPLHGAVPLAVDLESGTGTGASRSTSSSRRTLADDVQRLLADGHTGLLGTPGPANIYWESGRYLGGSTFWLAKKQYGANLVLWWYGDQKKVNLAFSRLHKPLFAKVVGS